MDSILDRSLLNILGGFVEEIRNTFLRNTFLRNTC